MTPGKQLSKNMLEIIRTAQAIKARAYDPAPNEHVQIKMKDLIMLVREASVLVDALSQPKQEGGDNNGDVTAVHLNIG